MSGINSVYQAGQGIVRYLGEEGTKKSFSEIYKALRNIKTADYLEISAKGRYQYIDKEGKKVLQEVTPEVGRIRAFIESCRHAWHQRRKSFSQLGEFFSLKEKEQGKTLLEKTFNEAKTLLEADCKILGNEADQRKVLSILQDAIAKGKYDSKYGTLVLADASKFLEGATDAQKRVYYLAKALFNPEAEQKIAKLIGKEPKDLLIVGAEQAQQANQKAITALTIIQDLSRQGKLGELLDIFKKSDNPGLIVNGKLLGLG
jgi:hypothetical protein